MYKSVSVQIKIITVPDIDENTTRTLLNHSPDSRWAKEDAVLVTVVLLGGVPVVVALVVVVLLLVVEVVLLLLVVVVGVLLAMMSLPFMGGLAAAAVLQQEKRRCRLKLSWRLRMRLSQLIHSPRARRGRGGISVYTEIEERLAIWVGDGRI